MREVERLAGRVWYTLVTGVLVTVVQWAVVATVDDNRVILVVLGVPALFAGGSMARLLAETTDLPRSLQRRGGGHR